MSAGPWSRLWAFAALGLAAAATGCGVSDERRVKSTVERFYRAAAQGDGRAACGQLSGGTGRPGSTQCEVSIEQLGELGGPEAKRRLASVDVIDTKVDGNTATTRAQVPGQTPVPLQLRRIDGEWKCESLGSQVWA